MDKETFAIAKSIREQINVLETKHARIRKMEPRNDDDFVWLRQQAFEGIEFAINALESDFKKL